MVNYAGATIRASVAAAGYTLVNGTGTIISWTAATTGAAHYLLIPAVKDVTSNETGGSITLTATLPDGTAVSAVTVIGGGQSTGIYTSGGPQFSQIVVKDGTTVTIAQGSALTAGASVVWAAIVEL